VQIGHTALELIQADLTPLDVDTIVNTANSSRMAGSSAMSGGRTGIDPCAKLPQ
jgi:O-acetyl-ADP-ribose deacetylase (regulator of RNase III)